MRQATSILLLFLCVLCTISVAQADSLAPGQSLTERVREIEAQGERQESQLKLEIRRITNNEGTGTPGTPAGRLRFSELEPIEAKFDFWKSQIEELLATPSPAEAEPHAAGEAQFAATGEKWKTIRAYFNALNTLATLRSALLPLRPLAYGEGRQNCAHRTHALDETWIRAHALRVPTEISELLPYEIKQFRDRMGETYSPVIAERFAEDPEGWLRLRPSAAFLRGVELAWIAQSPNEKSHLTLRKYVAIHQLMSKLEELRYFKPDHTTRAPEFKPALLNSIDTLCLNSLATSDRSADASGEELAFRDALIKTFAAAQTPAHPFPSFVNQKLIERLARALSSEHAAVSYSQIQELLALVLGVAEKDLITQSLEEELGATITPLLGASTAESLRAVLAGAKASALLMKLQELLADATSDEISPAQRKTVLETLQTRKDEYQRELGQAAGLEAIRTWILVAERANKDGFYASKRDELVETLLYRAHETTQKLDALYSGQTIDPVSLLKTQVDELGQLTFSPDGADWVGEIGASPTYALARATYTRLLSERLGKQVVVHNRVDPRKARQILADRGFVPSLGFTANTHPGLATRIEARIASGDRADLESIIAFGEVMGFHRSYSKSDPTVHEVLRDSGKEQAYFAHLSAAAETQAPILGMKIKTWIKGYPRPIYKRLAEALTAINPHRVNNPRIMSEAYPLVDQALGEVEKLLRQNIRDVSDASSTEQISGILRSSPMRAAFLEHFPEFELLEKNAGRRLQAHTLTERVLESTHPALMGIFIGDMAIRGAHYVAGKWILRSLPITSVLLEGFHATFGGLLKGALVLIAASDGHELLNMWEDNQRLRQEKNFVYCSALGACLGEAEELHALDSATTARQLSRAGGILANSALMYIPWLKGLGIERRARETMRGVEHDFELQKRLGTAPGDFDSLEARMKLARSLRQGEAPQAASQLLGAAAGEIPRMSTDEWQSVEKLFENFVARKKSGQLYRLSTLLDRVAVEDAFELLGMKPTLAPGAGQRPSLWSRAKKAVGVEAPTNPWEQIETARALFAKAAPNARVALDIQRAADFLNAYKKANPSVLTEPLESVAQAERELFRVLRRSSVGRFWTRYTLDQAAASAAARGGAP